MKIINQGPGKTAQTVGRETTFLANKEKPGGLMSALAKIQEQLTVQQGSIDQLVAEQNRQMRLEEQQKDRQQKPV